MTATKSTCRKSKNWSMFSTLIALAFLLAHGQQSVDLLVECHHETSGHVLESTSPELRETNLEHPRKFVGPPRLFGLGVVLPEHETQRLNEAIESVKVEPKAGKLDELQQSYFDKFGKLVQNFIAPTKAYVSTLNRLHIWFQNYKRLQRSNPSMRDPMDVLKEEYARVDELMLQEHCQEMLAAGQEAKPMNTETVDFVFRALQLVVGRLEAMLDPASKVQVSEADDLPVELEELGENCAMSNDDDRIKKAMDRVKRTAVEAAKRVVKGEIGALARISAFNAMASYIQTRPPMPGDPLSYLAPLICLLGSASTPLATCYLRNVEFRVAMSILKQMNPFSIRGCAKKPEANGELVPSEEEASLQVEAASHLKSV